jgi:hypothetical protein
VAIGQMHNGGRHDWIVCWRGQKMGCTRLNVMLLTNNDANGFDS